MRDGFVKVAAGTPAIRVADCRYNAESCFTLMREAAAQGVELLRQGKVAWRPGFDGEYGKLSFPGA